MNSCPYCGSPSGYYFVEHVKYRSHHNFLGEAVDREETEIFYAGVKFHCRGCHRPITSYVHSVINQGERR